MESKHEFDFRVRLSVRLSVWLSGCQAFGWSVSIWPVRFVPADSSRSRLATREAFRSGCEFRAIDLGD